MSEVPDLRYPALAARGRHPVVAVYDGSHTGEHALAYAAGLARRADQWLVIASRRFAQARMVARVVRHAACPAVVVP